MDLAEAKAAERHAMNELIGGRATPADLARAQQAVRDAEIAAGQGQPTTLAAAIEKRYAANGTAGR